MRGFLTTCVAWLGVAAFVAQSVEPARAAALSTVNIPVTAEAKGFSDEFEGPEEARLSSKIEDDAVRLLVSHLDHLRLKLRYNEPGVFFSNANEAVGTLLHAWQRDLGICAERRRLERKQICLKRTLKRAAQTARDQGLIDRVVEANLISMANRLLILENGKLAINIANAPGLPDLTSYLKARNKLALKRRERDPDGQTEAKLLATTNSLYRRKLPGVGKVTLHEYVVVTYSEAQLRTMGNLLTEALEMFSAVQGELVLTKYDGSVTRIPLEGSDINRLALDYIDREVHREVVQTKGKLQGVPEPKYADLLMASYLTGIVEGDVILALLQMNEMHEHYPTFFEKVGKIALGASRLVGFAFPEAYAVVNLGVVVYESLKQKDEYEKAQAAKAHLID